MFSLLLLKLLDNLGLLVPLTCGHLSSLSNTPSPSVSGQGQPAFSLGPATVGHLSFLSATSPSVSGQPFNETGPASLGPHHLYLLYHLHQYQDIHSMLLNQHLGKNLHYLEFHLHQYQDIR
jgi:hypothetical protein